MVNGLAAYARNRVLGASPAGLVLILLQEARRSVAAGRAALQQNKLEDAHRAFVRAQDIVYELRGALDFDAGEIAHNLARLYDFVLNGLMEANLKKREDQLDAVQEVLANLASAWSELDRQDTPAVGL